MATAGTTSDIFIKTCMDNSENFSSVLDAWNEEFNINKTPKKSVSSSEYKFSNSSVHPENPGSFYTLRTSAKNADSRVFECNLVNQMESNPKQEATDLVDKMKLYPLRKSQQRRWEKSNHGRFLWRSPNHPERTIETILDDKSIAFSMWRLEEDKETLDLSPLKNIENVKNDLADTFQEICVNTSGNLTDIKENWNNRLGRKSIIKGSEPHLRLSDPCPECSVENKLTIKAAAQTLDTPYQYCQVARFQQKDALNSLRYLIALFDLKEQTEPTDAQNMIGKNAVSLTHTWHSKELPDYKITTQLLLVSRKTGTGTFSITAQKRK
ncbi:hypothetical protein F9L33_02450 [Amylibacter sp. SFDW26]|uniref:hypothetical protein n=1 Tax=Amylibacter sp. SFDW26 TaxID=2652722 RepID=UPI001261704F|nr:hypothetical protein [Amylibacter sp. SFDW26]KAB7615641.1 hypothetical protein F9L33_02450 [Amylibacter sp. SFDW26]